VGSYLSAQRSQRGFERAKAVAAGGDRWRHRLLSRAVDRAVPEDVLDISGLSELRRIKIMPRYVRIGAGVTWSDLIHADLPCSFDGLKLAAREIGGIQIQNTATLVGNVCNASPAADGLPNLMALDAEVELASLDGRRQMPIGEFVIGNRKTKRRPDELVTALLVPRTGADAQSSFLKLGGRKYLIISIVMVAVVVEIAQAASSGRALQSAPVRKSRAAYLPWRKSFRAARWEARWRPRLGLNILSHLTPIDDLRATAVYRTRPPWCCCVGR